MSRCACSLLCSFKQPIDSHLTTLLITLLTTLLIGLLELLLLTCATGDDNKEESFSSQVTPGGILACSPHSVKWKGWWKLHFDTHTESLLMSKRFWSVRGQRFWKWKSKHLLGWIKFSVCCIHVNFGTWPQQFWMSLFITSTLTLQWDFPRLFR